MLVHLLAPLYFTWPLSTSSEFDACTSTHRAWSWSVLLFVRFLRDVIVHKLTHTKEMFFFCRVASPPKCSNARKTTFQKKNQRTVICLAFSPILIPLFPCTSVANKMSLILQHQQVWLQVKTRCLVGCTKDSRYLKPSFKQSCAR